MISRKIRLHHDSYTKDISRQSISLFSLPQAASKKRYCCLFESFYSSTGQRARKGIPTSHCPYIANNSSFTDGVAQITMEGPGHELNVRRLDSQTL